MNSIQVFHKAELKKGNVTPGITRDKAVESETILFGRTTIHAGAKSGWHHHGKRDLYGFLVSGKLVFECKDFPPVEISTGDFFNIAGGLVHRDVNPDPVTDAVVVNLIIGEGPPVINVEAKP